MILRRILILAAAAITLGAQIGVPRIGVVRDRGGALRPVLGVPGSFFLGEALTNDVLSAGFDREIGFAKKDSELLVFRGTELIATHAAPPGPAAFLFDRSGSSARVYFPSTEELWTVAGSSVEKESGARAPELPSRAEFDEVVLPNGSRLRLPEQIQSLEQLGSGWLIARCPSGMFAIRVDAAEPTVLQIPESGQ